VTAPLPHLAVVYDEGAASLRDIPAALAPLCTPVFVVRSVTMPVYELLGSLGPVVAVDQVGDTRAAAEYLLRRFGIQGIVTYSERMLPLTAQLVEATGLRGHSLETTRALTDKVAQRTALTKAGVPGPRYQPVSSAPGLLSAAELLGLPAVLKPVRGEGSRYTFAIRSPADLHSCTERLFRGEVPGDEYIVETMLGGHGGEPFGDYVSVECQTMDGRTTILAVTGKFPLAPPFREPGQFWPSHLTGQGLAGINKLAQDALRALGVRDGLSHVEMKLTAVGPRIIEVNGRLGGFIAELAKRHSGVDLIRRAAEIALGSDVPLGTGYTGAGVSYQFSNLAPPDARRLVHVDGARDLKTAPGFVRYRRMYGDDAPLAGNGSTDELDLISGSATSHVGMLKQLREQLGRLTFTFEGTSPSKLSGLELPSASWLREVSV
jgi:hypothetical protein